MPDASACFDVNTPACEEASSAIRSLLLVLDAFQLK